MWLLVFEKLEGQIAKPSWWKGAVNSCLREGGVRRPHVQSHLGDIGDIDTSLVLTALLTAIPEEKMQKG